MTKWECYKEADLPAAVPPPDEYKELILRKPFGSGRYRIKCNIIKKAKNSTLIEAYTKLVRVQGVDQIYWASISVAPYQRRVPTRLIDSPKHFI